MDNKGHNYRMLQRTRRHYGTKQDARSLKKQIRRLSSEIESLKVDRNIKADSLNVLNKKETRSDDDIKQINVIGKELKKIDDVIIQKQIAIADVKKKLSKNKGTVVKKVKSDVKNAGKKVKGDMKDGINTTIDLIKTYADSDDDGTLAASKITKVAVNTVGKTARRVGNKTYRAITYYPKSVARKTIRRAVSKIMKTVAKAVVKVVKALVEVVVKLLSQIVELLIASGGWIVLVILMVIVLLCIIIVKFDIGWFVGGDTEVAQMSSERYIEASQYLSTLQRKFNQQVNHESEGIPVYDNDGDNTNDILVTYVCLTFDIDMDEDEQSDELSDLEKEILSSIFNTMCSYELDIKQPEDDTPDKDGKKPEPEVISCTVTRHNLAWAIQKYDFTNEQKATLELVSQLSGGVVRADGLQVIIPGGSGNHHNNMVSGYVPDINISLTWPTLSNTITSQYGDTSDRDKPHKGVDVAPTTYGVAGDPIYAVADGDVKIAQWNNATAGTYVAISHDGGLYTRYLHMTDLCVAAGDTVTRGQLIGHMGTTGDSTGVHLHFDFAYNGAYINPMAYYNN